MNFFLRRSLSNVLWGMCCGLSRPESDSATKEKAWTRLQINIKQPFSFSFFLPSFYSSSFPSCLSFFFFDLPSFLQPSSKTFLINWNGIDKVLFRPSYLLIYFISSWAVGFVPKCILTGQFNSFSEMLKFNQLYVKTEGDLIVLSVVYFNYLFLI